MGVENCLYEEKLKKVRLFNLSKAKKKMKCNTNTQNDEWFEKSNSGAFILLVHDTRVREHSGKLGWQMEKGYINVDKTVSSTFQG